MRGKIWSRSVIYLNIWLNIQINMDLASHFHSTLVRASSVK
jgi:hypothetical protein